MKTVITSEFLDTDIGKQADSILRNCVHCGFCNATCPTYQLTGDELDGPRGRIYLIKQVLEGKQPSEKTLLHLDRCLTCRNCETTCPSGVNYSRLLDTGRHLTEEKVNRPLMQKLFRATLRKFLLSPLFYYSLRIARKVRPLLPYLIKRSIPLRNPVPSSHNISSNKKVLLIKGCVQTALQPSIDIAANNVFDQIGLRAIKVASHNCCGALNHHLSADDEAIRQIKTNIDSWLPIIEANDAEAITMTASGCGVMIRDYQHILKNDSDYADKAKIISDAYLDPIEIVLKYNDNMLMNILNKSRVRKRIAFHPPCTLQHGQKIVGQIESLLTNLGHELVNFEDSHLCCGSAGTYSITQKKLSKQLRDNKLNAITSKKAEIIVTANIGCQTHLQTGTDIPVRHWLELIAQ